ncbi:hypothetical protein HYX10_04365 [Candidatus Woesearchaeota archaeon]|nr:hypothetical protein [Candidatus Woesearchaeota archaeon]
MTWRDDVDGDVLRIGAAEIEELDNDDLKANEAGFLQGYEEYDEFY